MWFLCGGSCTGLVGRNQLWHGCTNGPLTGQINQAAPGLGHCPESTVRRESHLTPVHWLKGASIITVQHSPCHLLFLFLRLLPILFLLLPSLPCSPLVPAWFLFSPPSPVLLLLSCSATPLQPNRLPSGGCDLRRNVTSSIGCAPLKSVVTVSYYIVYLTEGGGSRTLTIFKSAGSGETTGPCLASLRCYVVRFIMSTVIPVRIGSRMRTRWRKLSLMLRCL